jgi:hypothetical protein
MISSLVVRFLMDLGSTNRFGWLDDALAGAGSCASLALIDGKSEASGRWLPDIRSPVCKLSLGTLFGAIALETRIVDELPV